MSSIIGHQTFKQIFKHAVKLSAFLALAALMTYGGLKLFSHNDPAIQTLATFSNRSNISKLPGEFMEQYFADYAEATASYDPANMLIVTSDSYPLAYGAAKVIEAPNHQYFLQYDSEEVKQEAYAKFQADHYTVQENYTQTVQEGEYNSWGISGIGLDTAIDSINALDQPNAITVAVIDTGLDMSAFEAAYPDRNLAVYDVFTGSEETIIDNHGHGTHVVGTVADGTPDNVSILAIRASTNGSFLSTDVITALNYAVSHGADIINMSFGGYSYDTAEYITLDAATTDHIVAIASAGNDGSKQSMYPAAFDNTLSVSALTRTGEAGNYDYEIAHYSNYGGAIDFAAPGTGIVSINGTKSGTSMAAPHITAAVAILKSYNSDLSLAETKDLLIAHATDLGEPGRDIYYGYGMIDFKTANFCTNDHCDTYGVFVDDTPTYIAMEVDEIKYTPRNYYSIQNLLATTVKLYTDDVNYDTKQLHELPDLSIAGYDTENPAEQTITIASGPLSTEATVTNPTSLLASDGWDFRVNSEDKVELTGYIETLEYEEDPEYRFTKLYIPSTIHGRDVVALARLDLDNSDPLEATAQSYGWNGPAFVWGYYDIKYFEEIIAPASLDTIEDGIFAHYFTMVDNPALKKVTFNADVVYVGDSAFSNLSSLETIDGVIGGLGEAAFYGNTKLKSITLGGDMTVVPAQAFSDCTSLETVILPDSVSTIGWSAFENAKALKNFNWPESLTSIDSNAFKNTYALTNVEVINIDPETHGISIKAFPDGLTSIGYKAFESSGLTAIVLPASLTDLGYEVFYDCGDLVYIDVDDSNEFYEDISEAALIGKNSDYLIRGTSLLPSPSSDVYGIGEGAYSGIMSITSVTIPESISSINNDAYRGCDNIKNVTLAKRTDSYGMHLFDTMDGNPRSQSIQFAVYYNAYTDDQGEYTANRGHGYALRNQYPYTTITASEIQLARSYEALESFSDNDDIYFYYDYAKYENDEYVKYIGTNARKVTKKGSDMVSTSYYWSVYNNHFRYNDRYFRVKYYDELGRVAPNNDYGISNYALASVTVTGTPMSYTLPTNLVGTLGEYLVTVELPDGFYWQDEYTPMNELGYHEFTAGYYPSTVDHNYYSQLTDLAIRVYVSENGEGPEEPIVPDITDATNDGTTYEVVEDGMTVTSDKACTIVVSRDGGETYERVEAVAVPGEDGKYKFTFDYDADTEVRVVLKGDADGSGVINLLDSNVINRSLLSPSSPAYRSLTPLETALLDLNGDGVVNLLDTNVINRSLLSPTSPAYSNIEW